MTIVEDFRNLSGKTATILPVANCLVDALLVRVSPLYGAFRFSGKIAARCVAKNDFRRYCGNISLICRNHCGSLPESFVWRTVE
ncbi:hypothetical protein [Mycobacteroides franklinii]|uniref:Uncharacterized protein n=1 Tax=Mycobacteroides franklinii TaxID=948102 RepID=A0A4R5PDX5_9MYCO|nr:hypothetical protein [Mycobacteroides franklinii]TDH23158.1 hypothetical protein EJ571_06775 [Mycobacteroides franklinii]